MDESTSGTGRAEAGGALHGPSMLFCPADRPDRYQKALDAADMIIIDLEDAVAPTRKAAARQALIDTPMDPERVVIRVNPAGTDDFDSDLAALAGTRYDLVMLAKAESVDQVRALSPWRVLALCETPRGILNSAHLAAEPNTIGLMWGAEDLVAAMGGTSSRYASGGYRGFAAHARSCVLMAAKMYARTAVDAVYLDFRDTAGLADEAEDAAASGWDLKACIHPSQVSVVRRAYRPSDDRIEWARKALEVAHAGGVGAVDGQMIDGPLVKQAEQIMRRSAY